MMIKNIMFITIIMLVAFISWLVLVIDDCASLI